MIALADGIGDWAFWEKPIQGAIQWLLVAALGGIGLLARRPLMTFIRDRERRNRVLIAILFWTLDIGIALCLAHLGSVARWGRSDFIRRSAWSMLLGIAAGRIIATDPSRWGRRESLFPITHADVSDWLTIWAFTAATYTALLVK